MKKKETKKIYYFVHVSDESKRFMIDEPGHVKRMQENPYYKEVTKTKWEGLVRNGGNSNNSTERNS